jgi:transcriptional regulator with XRE-family HTH domain
MGDRLKRLREDKNMTQQQLADAAGVSVWSLRQWEQGRRTMLFEVAPKLANALGITLDELAGRSEPAPKKRKKK